MSHASRYSIPLLIAFILAVDLWGQQAATQGITIRQAVDAALRNYPAITVSQQQIDAAAAGIQLARASYLPRMDVVAQVNRATRNNVFGLLLPQSVIPSISGPVLGTNNLDSVWGSAIGTTVTWEPFDFGLRGANVAVATTAKARSEATLKRTEFEIEVATADAFLTLLAAQEIVRTAQAGVERTQSLARSVKAQADAQLRPGADASRTDAELAAARTQLAQAEQSREVARAVLSQFIGVPPPQIAVTAGRLLQTPPGQVDSSGDLTQHPIAIEQKALIDQKQAELRALEKSFVPKFYAQGSAFARGTGAQTNGMGLGGANGLAPDTQNYAVGFAMTFSLFDRAAIHAKEAGQSATIRAETARYQQLTADLSARRSIADATMEGARKIAANTPVAVSSATTANQQASARYQAGLGTIVEVAEAQRLLTQVEIDDALARLSVWRAMLSVAATTGDIQSFLREATQ